MNAYHTTDVMLIYKHWLWIRKLYYFVVDAVGLHFKLAHQQVVLGRKLEWIKVVMLGRMLNEVRCTMIRSYYLILEHRDR